jgi:transposase-like protein
MDTQKTVKREIKEYSESLKLAACNAVLKEGLSFNEAAKKYGIGSVNSIRNWIYALGLDTEYKPSKLKTRYSESLKKEICYQVAYGRMTREHAMRCYGLRSATNITYWMKKYNITILEDTYAEPIASMKSKKVTSATENIRQENKLLKKELEEALLSSEVNAKIIELASKELGIDIRKKFNTKQ